MSEHHEQTLSDEIHLYLLLAGCQIAFGGSLRLDGRLVLAEQIAADIVQAGKRGIAAALNNGLDDDMNHQLFQATEPTAIADMILTGLLNCSE